MSVVLLLWRTRLRSSWRSAVILVVLIGLGGSVTLAVAAGARRTASANDAILKASNASDAATFVLPTEDADRTGELLRSVPSVSAVDLWIGFRGRLEGVDPASISTIYGFWSEQPTIDRPTVTSGRLPTAATEAFLNEAAAARSGLRVGSTLRLALADLSFGEFEAVELEIVGVGLFPDEVLEDELGEVSGVWFPRALTERLLDRIHYFSGRVRVAGGKLAALEPDLSSLPGLHAVVDERRGNDRDRVQEALWPLLGALAGLTVLAGGATVLVASQALGRTLHRRREDDRSLATMGCTTRQLVAADLAFAASVAGLGLVVAVALAVVASPLFPLGPSRRVRALGGVDVDLAALGALGPALAVMILIVVGTSSRRRRVSRGTLAPGRAPGPLGARPAPSTGLRMVTGRRGSASTIAGISAGLAVVIAALAFIGSLAHLLDQPALLGMGWDVIAREGYTTVDATRVRAAAEGEPSLQRISGLGYIDGELNGVKTPVAAVRSLLGAPWPPIVAGRAPASTSEILVGRTTLRSLHLRVGEQVHVALDRIGDGGGSRPGSESRTFTIVGSAVNPAISLEGSESPRLDRGALLLQDAYDEMFGTPMTSDIVLFDLADHRSASSLIARFPEGLPDQNDIPTEWFTSAVPAEVSQAQESRSVIGLAVASLSLAIVATVAHTLLGFVRQRRRDFAVLKALGFTRGQIRTTVLIQSGALLFVGLIAALPLGVAAGRWLWAGFAERIGVVVVPVVPMLLIVGATLLSILTVQGAALIPATLARRTQPGRTLHGE